MPEDQKTDQISPAGKTKPGAEQEPKPAPPAGEDPNKPNPTRYGDWEINGRCIDF
ncbi:MAG TPA: DUF1674 domain-containing protein [Alphaproteobacteria bacterium]|nr:DUF1674 domain-containing protein [Alphaproteobacteria bacterium]